MFPTELPIRNPDVLYNKAIRALGDLLQSIAQDEEPDRDEMMLIRTTMQILQKEKVEQHTNYQMKIKEQMRLKGGSY